MTLGIKFDLALEVLNVTFERLNIFFYTQYTMQHFYLQFEIVALTSRVKGSHWLVSLRVTALALQSNYQNVSTSICVWVHS